MTKKLLVCLGVCLMMGGGVAWADEGDDFEQIPSCGTTDKFSNAWQDGTRLYMWGYSETNREYTGCFSKLRVEAWINAQVTGGASVNEDGGIAVGVSYGRPMGSYMNTHAHGKHFLRNFGMLLNAGESFSPQVDMQRPPCDTDPAHPDCTPNYGNPGPPTTIPGNTPLLFDPAHDGFVLTSANDGVLFDVNGDGTPEQIAWTATDSDDAWLAMDRNGNGRIDNGTELFGNATPAYLDRPDINAQHGFDALDFLHHAEYHALYGTSYADYSVDGRDGFFSRLLLWTDRNHNGISESEELQSAASAGLRNIGVKYVERKRRDEHGNLFKLKGDSTWEVNGRLRSRVVWDVVLQTQ